jgi:hypothetical protein
MTYRGALEINLKVREQECRFGLLQMERAAADRANRAQARELRIGLATVLRGLAQRIDPVAPLSAQGEPA